MLRFGFHFCLSGASVVCAGSYAKADRPPETRHDYAVFLIGSGRTVKIPGHC